MALTQPFYTFKTTKMRYLNFTVRICLNKNLKHWVIVNFMHGFGLYNQNKIYSPEDNIEIYNWTFEPVDIDLTLYPEITRYNLMPIVDENEIDWVLTQN